MKHEFQNLVRNIDSFTQQPNISSGEMCCIKSLTNKICNQLNTFKQEFTVSAVFLDINKMVVSRGLSLLQWMLVEECNFSSLTCVFFFFGIYSA